MFKRVCLVEQDVWICHDVLRLKVKRREIAKTRSSLAIAGGVINSEAESRQHRYGIKALFYEISRCILRNELGDVNLSCFLDVHIISCLLLFRFAASEKLFAFGRGNDDAKPARFFAYHPS